MVPYAASITDDAVGDNLLGEANALAFASFRLVSNSFPGEDLSF